MARAVAVAADGILRARNPSIWGSGATASASDFKQSGAWDYNLANQAHVRNSLCIHAQTVVIVRGRFDD